jgi:hypothetical protein
MYIYVGSSHLANSEFDADLSVKKCSPIDFGLVQFFTRSRVTTQALDCWGR